MKLPMDQIDNDEKYNCRGHVDGISTESLQLSIANQGLLQPIVVREIVTPGLKPYRVVAGFSRYKACQMLGWKEIDVKIIQCTDQQAPIINLTENVERKTLTLEQEARAVKFIRENNPDKTGAEIAKLCNQSYGWFQNREAFLKLPPDIQAEFSKQTLPFKYIRQLVKLESKDKQYAAVRYLKDMMFRQEDKEVNLEEAIDPEIAERAKVTAQKNEPRQARALREIHMMNEHIIQKVGQCLATRVLAWAACEVTSSDLFHEIKAYCDTHGIDYTIPQEEVTQTR